MNTIKTLNFVSRMNPVGSVSTVKIAMRKNKTANPTVDQMGRAIISSVQL